MSSTIAAELPPLPSDGQVSALAETLRQGFKSGEFSARALKMKALRARLDAMRLAPVPATAREAMARSAEAARLAREAGALAAEAGAAGQDLSEDVGGAILAAREVVAKARRGVKPGSREEQELMTLQAALGGDAVTASTVDVVV